MFPKFWITEIQIIGNTQIGSTCIQYCYCVPFKYGALVCIVTAVLCFFFFLFFSSDFQICTLRQVLTLSRPSATAESEGFFFLKTQCHGTLAIAWSIYFVFMYFCSKLSAKNPKPFLCIFVQNSMPWSTCHCRCICFKSLRKKCEKNNVIVQWHWHKVPLYTYY